MLPSSAKVKKKKSFSRGREKKSHYYRLKMKFSNLSMKEKTLLPSSLSIYFREVSSPMELQIKEILKLNWFEIWEYASCCLSEEVCALLKF